MNNTELVQKAGVKLRDLLKPVILRDYPELEEQIIDYAFQKFTSSLSSWYCYMSRYMVQHREVFLAINLEGDGLVEIPQIVPGFVLKPVDRAVARKAKEIFMFYLNLYDWLTEHK